MHAAAINNHVDVIEYLLDKGLDINECANDFCTEITTNLLNYAKIGNRIAKTPRYNEIRDVLKRAGICSD